MIRSLHALTLAAGVVLATTACGAGPTAPTPPQSPIHTLLPGPYHLTLSALAPPDAVAGAFVSVTLCAMIGTALPTSTRATLAVEVTLDGDAWRVSNGHGDLALRLARAGNGVSGAGLGRAQASDGLTVELGQGGVPAQLDGRIGSGGSIDGRIDGGLTFSLLGSSISCSPSGFTMSRR